MDKDKFKSSVLSNNFSTDLDVKSATKIIKDSIRPLKKELNKDGTLNLIIATEELNELAQQTLKYVRGRDNHYELLEELADGYLSIFYIKQVCGISDAEFNKAVNIKLARQSKRNKEETF